MLETTPNKLQSLSAIFPRSLCAKQPYIELTPQQTERPSTYIHKIRISAKKTQLSVCKMHMYLPTSRPSVDAKRANHISLPTTTKKSDHFCLR